MKRYKKLIVVAGISLFLLLLFVGSVKASPSSNPIFATIEQVQQMITDALAPIQQRLTALESKTSLKVLRVYDNNGVELGRYWAGGNDDFVVLVESLGLFMPIHDGHIGDSGITEFFESIDCSGQAYTVPWERDLMIKRVGNRYFYVPVDAKLVEITPQSQIVPDLNNNCAPYEGSARTLAPLTPVSVPFSDPIPLPLHVKFQ